MTDISNSLVSLFAVGPVSEGAGSYTLLVLYGVLRLDLVSLQRCRSGAA